MSELLLKWDYQIFEWINSNASTPLGDAILPWAREKLVWFPFYIFLIALIIQDFGRKSYIIIITMLLLITVCDQLSSKLIKPTVQRQRPCNTETLQDHVRVLAPCTGSYSFPSSHAVNHFAIGCFSFLLFGKYKKWRWLFFCWAGLIAVAQVYVGLHFPIDITVGAAIGIVLAWIFYKILEKRFLFVERNSAIA